mgnify:CR=1 FL=1
MKLSNIKKRWQRFAVIGFLIGMIPLLFYLWLDLSCTDAWCGLKYLEIGLISYITLVPLYFILLLLSWILNLDKTSQANILLYLMYYSYPIVYALYGAIIGWIIERRRRRKK